VTPPEPIVDGHGPDATHPPGPEHERLAEALRRVTNQLVLTAATSEQLTRAAEQVEAVAQALDPVTPEWTLSVPAFVSSREPHRYFPFSPQIGLFNPLAPPMRVWIDDDGSVHGAVNLDAAYEGPPGCVHGGIIASLFDEILGVANITAEVGAMTGTLTIKYRSPTPLKTDLTVRAHVVGVEGRKVRTEGTIHAGDRLCAECEGIFIIVNHETFHLDRD
jgi:acyl-coenzyme A thioesterase PaaI-like protein